MQYFSGVPMNPGRTKETTRPKKLDRFDMAALRRVVHRLYSEGTFPTLKKITQAWNTANQDKKMCPTTVSTYLKFMGFQ